MSNFVDRDKIEWSKLDETQRAAYARAKTLWIARERLHVPREICGEINLIGERCDRPAGHNTEHPGWGACSLHRGRRRRGRLEAAWLMGHKLAQELNVTPWQAILHAVRREAAEAAWYDEKIREGDWSDEDIRPGGDAWDWVRGSRESRERMARYAKMAIDAGVAERLVRETEASGRLVAVALARALDALELTDDQRATALQAARRELMAAESDVEGEVVTPITGRRRGA